MRKLLAVLYTGLALGANAVLADPAALREGDMRKLAFHEAPVAIPAAELLTIDDQPASLGAYAGKWMVLNFWATWCVPCREEMPSLDQLQADMPEIAVVPLATGANEPAAIRRFYDQAGLKNLPILRDPRAALGRQMGVMAMPVTVIVNPEGEEVARLIGDAVWDSDNAKAILKALVAGG
ncbi:TlpA family protein disulfide reductase [Pseudogemmobacter faecipullorum]